MASIKTEYVRGTADATPSESGDYVIDKTTTKSGQVTYNRGPGPTGPYRRLHLSLDDGQVATGGADTETVEITVVDGLEVVRGTDPSNATVLNVDSDVTVEVDGTAQTVSLTGGSGSIEISTGKSAGSTIDVEAVGLADKPAESDSATIEVIS